MRAALGGAGRQGVGRAALLWLWSSFALATPVRADEALVALGRLLAGADHIALGTVSAVTAGATPGSQLAAFSVDENWRGSLPANVTLRGSTRDPSLRAFSVGLRLVVFLDATPDGFEPVTGASGILVVSSDRIPSTRALVVEWVEDDASIRLADMRDDCLIQPAPAPPLLLAQMLEEMTKRFAPADAPLTAEMACNLQGEFLPAAQSWALLRIGERKISSARGCVEQILTSHPSLANRLAASETLGVLGDPASLPALLGVIEAESPTEGSAGALTLSAVLAAGKLRDERAVEPLERLISTDPSLATGSTVVNALGLIGGRDALAALRRIGHVHPDKLVRTQAHQTFARLQSSR